MEATPDVYRADIAHTQHHIALIDSGDLLGDTHEQAQERRERLVRQLANLQRALARAEVLWAQAQAQGAGARTLKARWAARRPGWNDNHSLQVWLASGATFAVGAPSRALALDAAQRMAQEQMGVPVHLLISNPRSR